MKCFASPPTVGGAFGGGVFGGGGTGGGGGIVAFDLELAAGADVDRDEAGVFAGLNCFMYLSVPPVAFCTALAAGARGSAWSLSGGRMMRFGTRFTRLEQDLGLGGEGELLWSNLGMSALSVCAEKPR